MELIYAAMLLHKLGKPVTEDSVKKVIEAAGGTVNVNQIKALIAALQGVNIEEAIKKAAVPVAAPVIEKKEAKVEEKKEEKVSEEKAAAGLSALFG